MLRLRLRFGELKVVDSQPLFKFEFELCKKYKNERIKNLRGKGNWHTEFLN